MNDANDQQRVNMVPDEIVYVLNADGAPLKPMFSYARARRKLETGKAVIASYEPFTIRLTYQIHNPDLDGLVLGIDPGRTNEGLAVIDGNGRVLWVAKLVSRNKDIRPLMEERARHRRNRRSHEKTVRNRREVAVKKGQGIHDAVLRRVHRLLPGCDEPICCHVTKNTEARFLNRNRPEGWLTPSARQCLETHEHAIELVRRFLPISRISLEVNKFDLALMEAGSREAVDYGHGPLFGYNGLHDAVDDAQGGKCLLCEKKEIEHYHHIVNRHENGSDTLANIAGLCDCCHDAVHKDEEAIRKLKEKKAGQGKKYAAASLMNQVIPSLIEYVTGLDGISVYLTTGTETKLVRESFGLAKDHHVDAWCIAASSLAMPPVCAPAEFAGAVRHDVVQFRRHDRQVNRRYHDRKYYLDGKLVARNRHKKTGQTDDSLEEFVAAHPGEASRLRVERAHYVRNDMSREMAGAVFLFEGKRYVSFGVQSRGERYTSPLLEKGYVSTKKCRLVSSNTGLVFLGHTLDELDMAKRTRKEKKRKNVTA